MTTNPWQQLIGHQWAAEEFSAAIRAGRLGHAYLLSGPAQIGKTTLARLIAQAINCENEGPARRPCGACRACRLIATDRHPDVRLVAPAVGGRGRLELKIETIRELQSALSLTAAEARHKVAILRQFDAANPAAANAFLKTLEEPPPAVVLLLTAEDAQALLPTIVSRCRAVALRPAPADEIEAAL
ncbi:MAG: ATP-binding protein, partial [Candidatus Promineifilaceae bacterium]